MTKLVIGISLALLVVLLILGALIIIGGRRP